MAATWEPRNETFGEFQGCAKMRKATYLAVIVFLLGAMVGVAGASDNPNIIHSLLLPRIVAESGENTNLIVTLRWGRGTTTQISKNPATGKIVCRGVTWYADTIIVSGGTATVCDLGLNPAMGPPRYLELIAGEFDVDDSLNIPAFVEAGSK